MSRVEQHKSPWKLKRSIKRKWFIISLACSSWAQNKIVCGNFTSYKSKKVSQPTPEKLSCPCHVAPLTINSFIQKTFRRMPHEIFIRQLNRNMPLGWGSDGDWEHFNNLQNLAWMRRGRVGSIQGCYILIELRVLD